MRAAFSPPRLRARSSSARSRALRAAAFLGSLRTAATSPASAPVFGTSVAVAGAPSFAASGASLDGVRSGSRSGVFCALDEGVARSVVGWAGGVSALLDGGAEGADSTRGTTRICGGGGSVASFCRRAVIPKPWAVAMAAKEPTKNQRSRNQPSDSTTERSLAKTQAPCSLCGENSTAFVPRRDPQPALQLPQRARSPSVHRFTSPTAAGKSGSR